MLRHKDLYLQHEASDKIREFLERDVGLDETLPELPLLLARVILDAPFVSERDVPCVACGLAMLFDRYRKYCKHLDVPYRLVDRVKDKAMWLEILTEAFSDHRRSAEHEDADWGATHHSLFEGNHHGGP